jgi:hypothetical protein
MSEYIALESLLQRGRSSLYIDLVSLYQESFDALYDAPGTTNDYIVDKLKSIGFTTRLVKTINKHLGDLIVGTYVTKTTIPNLHCFTGTISRSKHRNKPITHGSLVERINKVYNNKTGVFDYNTDAHDRVVGKIAVSTAFWKLRNTDNTYYFTAEELAAATLHEIGHIDYYIRTMDRVSSRLQDASDIAEYISTHSDTKDVLLLIEALKKSPDLDSSWLKVLGTIEKYFSTSNSRDRDDEYNEALSTISTIVTSDMSSYTKQAIDSLELTKSNTKQTLISVVDKERSSDEYSFRHGTYSALSSFFLKTGKLSTKDIDVYYRLFSDGNTSTILKLLEQFLFTFGIHAEDIANGYDSDIRRMELAVETAKHAFSDEDLPDDVKSDIKQQIAEIDQYLHEYKAIPHRELRKKIYDWKENIVKFGRVITLPFSTRLGKDYETLQNHIRSLSRHSLNYLAKK